MKFENSQLCVTRQYCNICRNKEDGRKWRKLVGRIYEIDNEDFECPENIAWLGDTPYAKQDEVKPVVKVKSPRELRREINGNRLQLGKVLKYNETYLRKVLPANSGVIVALDIMAVSEKQGGCRGCRAKKLFRRIGVAFEESTNEEQILINSVINGPK